MSGMLKAPCVGCGRTGIAAGARGVCTTCYRWEKKHARVVVDRGPGYDPVWGHLTPPSTGPDPADFPPKVVPAVASGRRARPRPHSKGRPRTAGGHEG